MSNRTAQPDAAFACVFEHRGIQHKLLRHHHLDRVRDGNEHDTVDPRLLTMALRMVDQLPVTDESREEARKHLMEHKNALARLVPGEGSQPDNVESSDPQRRDLENDNDLARRIVSEQAAGPDGNQNLKNPRKDSRLEPDRSAVVRTEDGTTTAQLAQDNAGGSITGGGSTPTRKGKEDTDAGRPKGDHQDTLDVNVTDDVEKKPTEGKGSPAHDDVVSVGDRDASRPGVESDGATKFVGNPGSNETPEVPVSKSEKKTEAGPRAPLPQGGKPPMKDKKTKAGPGVGPDGKPIGDPRKKEELKKKSKVNALHQDILEENPSGLTEKRPNLENINPGDKGKNQPGVKAEATDQATAPKHTPEFRKKKKKAQEQEKSDKPVGGGKPEGGSTYAGVGDWVRNDEGVVGVITSVSETGKAKIRVPSGRTDTSGGWKVIVKASEVDENDSLNLLANELRILNSPEALKIFATPTPEGQTARKNKICLCSVDQLTEAGRSFIRQRFNNALQNKCEAKILGSEVVGQRELITVRMGENEEFPFTVLLEVFKDGEGKVEGVRFLHDSLPVEVLRDFANFLTRLAKEGKSESSVEQTEAGPKLDRCVSEIMQQKLRDFRKKNGKEPTKKQRQEMESSAFAICRSQGLK